MEIIGLMRKIPLWLSILGGMFFGVVYVVLAIHFGWNEFTYKFVRPFGIIFVKMLKLMAIPLIFFSLINGIASLKNISGLSSIGLKTIGFYIFTTFVAIIIGLVLGNVIKPGKYANVDISNITVDKNFTKNLTKDNYPLGFLEDIVPDNIVEASSDNKKMLQVIFFAIFFGIALVKIGSKNSNIVLDFVKQVNNIILKMIDFIMLYAPFGVFALIADVFVSFSLNSSVTEVFKAVLVYSFTVILGLLAMILILYPLLLKIFTNKNPYKIIKQLLPVQLLAFSTSSSAATLPFTMEICEKKLNVSKEISSFVLPIGATVNMDGTSLYQSVAALFIAQIYGIDLSLSLQLTIVITALLASIGAAAVPGAGIVMLVIVLNSVGLPNEGIALILAVDRLLDMMRTVVNVTSDATVSFIIDSIQRKASLAQ